MRITQPECVFVALGIRHVMRMRRVVICGTIFGKKKILDIKRVF